MNLIKEKNFGNKIFRFFMKRMYSDNQIKKFTLYYQRMKFNKNLECHTNVRILL